MKIEANVTAAVVRGIKTLYGQDIAPEAIQLEKTKKDFAGHLTLVVFPFLKISRKKPEDTAQEIGNFLKQEIPSVVADFNNDGFMDLFTGGQTWEERHTTGSQGQDTLAWTWWDDTRFCVNNGDGTYEFSFEFVDDLGYTWDGTWSGAISVNDESGGYYAPSRTGSVKLTKQRLSNERKMEILKNVPAIKVNQSVTPTMLKNKSLIFR